jgi:hypothetical protein
VKIDASIIKKDLSESAKQLALLTETLPGMLDIFDLLAGALYSLQMADRLGFRDRPGRYFIGVNVLGGLMPGRIRLGQLPSHFLSSAAAQRHPAEQRRVGDTRRARSGLQRSVLPFRVGDYGIFTRKK